MVRTTTRDDEAKAEASVSTPDYRLTGVDLVDVSEGDRITFTTTTKRSNGVPLRSKKTLTVDDVTVTEEDATEMVEVDPEWLPDGVGIGKARPGVESATLPRDTTETHVEVVAIDDGTRYTLRQVDTGFVRVSSCDQSDYVDQNERGEWNAVARSNVSHGILKSWSHDVVVTDGGVDVPDVIGFTSSAGTIHFGTASGTGTLCGFPVDEWVGFDAPNSPDAIEDKHEHACERCVSILRSRRPDVLCDGGRPPRDSFDHAPDVGPSDVDKCRECGRYAPHVFDHNPECSRFEPIEDEPDVSTTDSVTPSASANPRMVRPKADGGTPFDTAAQSPERIASEIVASEEGDDVVVWCGHGDHFDTLSIFEGEVVSTGYKERNDVTGGTHVVAIDVAGTRVAVHFDRVVDTEFEGNLSTPHAELFDPEEGARLPVTRFEGVDG